jgi:hypothetical protein
MEMERTARLNGLNPVEVNSYIPPPGSIHYINFVTIL